MKTKIKRHSRSVISVLLSVCMLVSGFTVGLLTTDAAKVAENEAVAANANDVETVGAQAGEDNNPVGAQADTETVGDGTTYYLKFGTASNPSEWNKSKSSSTPTFTIYPSDISSDATSFSVGTNYYVGICEPDDNYKKMWSQGGSSAAVNNSKDLISTSNESNNADNTTYNFAHFSVSDDTVSSVTVSASLSGTKTTYTFSATASAGTTTWTVAGSSTELFTSSWGVNDTRNDLTEPASGTVWSKTYPNVYLSSGTIEYKVAKNHKWTVSYPSSNATKKVTTAGYYDVTVTFDSSSHDVKMTLSDAVKYTLTVPTVANATVTANYGSNSAAEDGLISDIPAGANVTVNVTPDSGYKCTAVAAGSNSGTASGNKWTVQMPAANTELSVTMEAYTAPIERVYFYNKYTQYPMVNIYAYYKSGDTITEKLFGSGKNMTKMSNSDIWYADLPNNAYIQFIGEGHSTGELKPLNEPHGNKYIPGPEKTAPGTGGYWGDYVDRNNIYTVSDGENMSAEGLFTGINATFYDYYVDNEVTGGWIDGIHAKSDYYCSSNTNDPYRQYLNAALVDYANETADHGIPANNITYPLYWGNNKDGNDGNVTQGGVTLYDYNRRANVSDGLTPNATAIQGLAGNTLTGGTIHHYKNDSENNYNGAAMAFFDEDFLSGENSKGVALATILHSSSFPVRKQELRTIYCGITPVSGWSNDSHNIYAYFWASGKTAVKVAGTDDNGVFSFNVPIGYTDVLFYRAKQIDGNWDNQTPNLTILSDKNYYTSNSTLDNTHTGTWSLKSDTTVTTHTYYEYDSSGGKDNAFITDINTTNHTANLSYYTDKHVVSQSNGNPEGFFPFDYNNLWDRNYNPNAVYLKPSTKWLQKSDGVDPRFAAYFYKEDDNTWKSMSRDNSTGYYTCEIPEGYSGEKVIFCRMNGNATENNWENKFNQTGNLDVPTNTNEVLFTVPDDSWDNATTAWSNGDIAVPFTGGNSNTYAESGSIKLAHDQGFGTKLEIPFTLTKNGLNSDGTAQTFEFSGDDDLWVYIDNKLVLDLGGAHARTTGSINFNTMKAVADTSAAVASGDGAIRTYDFSSIVNTKANNFNADKVHTMTIYYMERGMFDSNLKFGFSFHAIPNQFMAEKKVRTRVVEGYTNNFINPGFFADNGQSSTASNMSGVKIDNGTRGITKFENSFQTDTFTFTQTYAGTLKDDATSLKYVIGDNTTTVMPSNKSFTYDMHNNNDGENIAYFNGQFNSGETFTLKESSATNNKYNYDTYLIVYDDAANSKKFAPVSDVTAAGQVSGNNTDGYTFRFSPTTLVASGGLEDLRIRARFENSMREHSLTIKKDALDFSGDKKFEFKILFDFEGNGNYISYPLEILNSTEKVAGDGTFSLLGNESITLEGIPEKAKIKLIETSLNGNDTYSYDRTIVRTDAGAEYKEVTELGYISGTQEGGVTFEMGTADTIATVRNAAAQPVFISHTLHPDSRGDAYCFVSAEVQTSNGTVVENGTFDETQGIIQVGTNFINKASVNNLVITLRTVPKGNSLFDGGLDDDSGFYEKIGETLNQLAASGIKYTAAVDTTAKTATITVPIQGLFDIENGGKQLYTQLPFFSKTKLPPYRYEITYNFGTRKLIQEGKLSENRLWGNQFYKSVAEFTDAEVDQYIDLSGTPTFKSGEIQGFLAKVSPYETNFKENTTWSFDQPIEYNPETYTFSSVLTASQENNTTIHVSFMMPFNYTLNTDTRDHYTFSVDKVNGKEVYVNYGEVQTTRKSIDMDFLDWFSLNDVHNQSQVDDDNKPELLTVPKVLYSSVHNDKKRVFRYWEYYTETATGEPGICYQKSYDPSLNQAIYQNTILKPVYTEEMDVSAQNPIETKSDKSATITFLGTTRDQWNYNGGGQTAFNIWGSKFADRIFTDFVLSFEYEGKKLNSVTSENFKTGLIIETLSPTEGGITKTTAETLKTAAGTENGTGKAITKIKACDADITETAAAGNYMISYFNNQELDPRNAIEYYYGIANVSQSKNKTNDTYTDETTRRNYGYRAYSFMKKGTGYNAEVTISDPVYFTIYDIATITNGSSQVAS